MNIINTMISLLVLPVADRHSHFDAPGRKILFHIPVRVLLIGLSISALLNTACQYRDPAAAVAPNVLIILTDDLGYGDISCYESDAPNTLHIDGLAAEGVLCSDFYVPTPYCAPSRATLLTGRFPLRHGIIRNPAPDAGIDDVGIAADEITLGEIYRESGYRTKLIGKWHLGHREEFFPIKHGFDEYYGILYSNDMRPVQIIENMDTVEYPVDQSFLTRKYTAKAVQFIKENRENRFFLHLCHAMPHKPLAASRDFYTPGTRDDLYADVIRELDWSTGEILATLEELKILDRTIVIFMSDNGPSWGGNTGPLKGKKATNWEGGVRVPFIIRYPGTLPSGKVVETPCWSPDLFPTLLSMCGIEIPENLLIDGENIQEVLKGDQHEHGAVFTMKGDSIRTVRKGGWKLYRGKPDFHRPVDLANWVDKRAPDGNTIIAPFEQPTPALYPGIIPGKMDGEIFLFNLEQDISEMSNVSASHPDIVTELEKEYEVFMSSFE
jgi:arylsulfatase A-like enzyme